MAEFRLETERLVLRDWREEDWEPFFRDTNTPAVMRWLGGVFDADKVALQRTKILDYRREHGFTFWAVERKEDGELLGFCGLKRSNQEGGPIGDVEIGWRLREDAWGKGYAREAALAVRDDAFARIGAPYIISLTVPGNEGSWGLMQRIGMRRREDLDFESADFGDDTIIAYSLDRAEWEGLRDAA